MSEQIINLIINLVKEYGEETEFESLKDPKPETELYGVNGVIDSISLVSLISDLEMQISDEFNKDIILADERAMSQKNSPFKTIQSLAAYIEKLLMEEE